MSEPLADLYVCWRCADHDIAVAVDADPPAYHDACGWGPLDYSGRLMSWDADTGRTTRTYDEFPPKVAQHPRPGTQLDFLEGL